MFIRIALAIVIATARFDVARYFGSAPATVGGVALTSQPDGGWTWIQDPRAVGYGGYTYFGYVAEGTDIAMRSIVDGGTTASSEIILHSGSGAGDEHNAPTFLVRDSDHKLLVYYQVNGSPTEIYQRISVNSLDSDPTLSGGFGSASSLDALGLDAPVTGRNYPNPIQLTGEVNDPIYMFYRDNAHTPASNGTWRYAKSTDGGATWVYQAALCQSATLSNWGFLKMVQNGDSRIDFMFTNNSATGSTGSVYHFYYSGGSWFKSDGSSAGSPNHTESHMTLVYDGSTTPGWLTDIAIRAGHPIFAYPTFVTATDHRYNYAVESGGTWTSHEIIAAGSYMATAIGPGGLQTHYPAGLALDSADPQIVYASVQSSSTAWELWKYVTADAGATFTPTAITSGTAAKNIRPVSPRNQGTRKVLWTQGTWDDYTIYNLRVMSQ